MKVTLLHKGLLLVSIPLCFELVMFSVLIHLQNEVEREAARLEHKKEINDNISSIITTEMFMGDLATKYIRGRVHFSELKKSLAAIRANYATLVELTKDDPQSAAIIKTSQAAQDEAMNILQNTRQKLLHLSETDDADVILTDGRHAMDRALASAISEDFLMLATKYRVNDEVQKNIEQRHRITLILNYAVAMSVTIGLGAGFLFSRQLASRIVRVTENAKRFAKNEPLAKVIAGNDEIAELDATFHNASRQIEAARRKERAILDNATDVIFSLNENLVITSVNQSSETLIGKSEDKLVNYPFVSLLAGNDANQLTSELKQIVGSTHRTQFETQIVRELSDPVDVVIAASYSPRDRAYYCVMHDVSHQREIERLRREVTAMITHDLRTPLQTIKNFLEMLKVGMLGELNQQGTTLLTLTEQESTRMTNLISQVLTLEKIRSGTVGLNLEPVLVSSLVTSCAEALRLLASEKHIEIQTSCAPDLSVTGDRVWLDQILINVVSNGIKFSPPETTVRIIAENGGEMVRISIEDEGPGIPHDEQKRIFERFHRVAATSSKTGSGLGLNICRELVLLHQGTIEVESEPGRGSTFIITLPKVICTSEPEVVDNSDSNATDCSDSTVAVIQKISGENTIS